MSWAEAWKVLQELPDDWPAIRVAKCQALYETAAKVSVGCIVELGSFVGLGATALALGSRDGHHVPVYTIDDRKYKHGWAGEPYSPADLKRFADNLTLASVQDMITSIVGESVDVAASWSHPVSLLFWDLGLRDRVSIDFEVWERHLLPGGLFLIKDIEEPGFGRPMFPSHWQPGISYPAGFVFSYRKGLT